MTLHLAWRDLLHRRARTMAALAGILFAIVLIFMQIGFYLACRTSATRIHALLDYDLLLTSARYSFILEADSLARELLERARGVPGVATVSGVRLAPNQWRSTASRNHYDTVFLGVDPADSPFALAEVNRQLARLHPVDTVLFDQAAHPILGRNTPGVVSEFNRRRATVVGGFEWGVGFVANGVAIISNDTFSRAFPGEPADELQLGLIRLAPNARASDVLQHLTAQLPVGARAWTRAEIEALDRRFFLSERPIGLMFQSGVVLALVVGGIILFQVLASEVTHRRAELATLQALGYTRSQVYRVVAAQGFLYTLMAFVPAALVALMLFRTTRRVARLPMELTPGLLAAVLALSLLMCTAGALLASRRVRSADPADLF
ncbi:MAG: FtsX-like permease family protein [Acidobacteriota bacterium]